MTDQRTALAPLKIEDVQGRIYLAAKEGDWDEMTTYLDEVLRNAADATLPPADRATWDRYANELTAWLEGEDEYWAVVEHAA